MKRTLILSAFLFLINGVLLAQYLPGEVKRAVADKEMYTNLDSYQVSRLKDFVESYNQGVDYYNKKDYESAEFYFDKTFKRHIKEIFNKSFWKGPSKNNRVEELKQNMILFRYICKIKIGKADKGDLEDAYDEVQDKCPPTMVRVAQQVTDTYNKSKSAKDQVDYKKFEN